MSRMSILELLAGLALLGSIAWMVANPGFEPCLAIIGAISALVAPSIIEEEGAERAQQHQSLSEGSEGVQAGGDVRIGGIDIDKDAK